MLCKPSTAARCIQSFDGSVLFMPKSAADSVNARSLDEYEFSAGRLNLFSYYFLVLVTWTGFLTLVGRTKSLIGREEDSLIPLPDRLRAEKAGKTRNIELSLSKDRLLTHIQSVRPDTSELFIKRRFEYEFGNILSVVMLHLVCDQERLHLFEIYHIHIPLCRYMAKCLSRLVGAFNGVLFPFKDRNFSIKCISS